MTGLHVKCALTAWASRPACVWQPRGAREAQLATAAEKARKSLARYTDVQRVYEGWYTSREARARVGVARLGRQAATAAFGVGGVGQDA